MVTEDKSATKGTKASKTKNSKQQLSVNQWTQKRRLEFIDFRLNFEGRLNRSDVVKFFGISIPQSSLDFCRYRELVKEADPNRTNFYYDAHLKVYVKADDFKPLFEEIATPEHYLNDLLALTNGDLSTSRNYFGFIPNVGISSFTPPRRNINKDVLFNVLEAIKFHYAIHITYMSVSANQNKDILVVPHGLAYDGLRWHMRAYSYSSHAFRDYVLSRIIRCSIPEIPAPNDRYYDSENGGVFKEVGTAGKDDIEWNSLIDLVLKANPELEEGARRAIEIDYGIEPNGTIVYTCRRALAFYTLQWLRLTKEYDCLPPSHRQLVLVNADEVNRRLAGGN